MAEMIIGPNVYPVSRGRTKWEILQARAAELKEAAERAQRELDGLEVTACGIRCSGCNTMLYTEKDFAAHFVVRDERLLNLGYCPVADKR